jgi:PAS domain-containing protein
VTEVRQKLLTLITVRAAVISLLLGSAVLIQITSPGSIPIGWVSLLIGVTFGLTAVYSLTVRQAENYHWLIDVQLLVDAMIVSAIVYVTGGINSYFSSLYALPIIAASAIRSWRGGMMIGTASSCLYAAIVTAQYSGSQGDEIVATLPPLREALYRSGLNVFGLFVVAALTGYLAEGLRRADAQLQRASTELADMQAFSRHVVDSLMSGLATTDMDGVVMTFNRAGEAITGIRSTQAIGRQAADVLQLPGALGGRLSETIRSFLSYARAAAPGDEAHGRPADHHRDRDAAAEQLGAQRKPPHHGRCPGGCGVVPGGRKSDPANRLEPGDQRIACDAAGRPADFVGDRTHTGNATGGHQRVRRRRWYFSRGARRDLSTVSRRLLEGNGSGAVDRASDCERLLGRSAGHVCQGDGHDGAREISGPIAAAVH